jgi:hypothetical protein
MRKFIHPVPATSVAVLAAGLNHLLRSKPNARIVEVHPFGTDNNGKDDTEVIVFLEVPELPKDDE